MADSGGTSLKFNNLRIPIGTSTQRSPWKYRSHMYPYYITAESTHSFEVDGSITLRVVMKSTDNYEHISHGLSLSDITSRSVLRDMSLEGESATHSFELGEFITFRSVLISLDTIKYSPEITHGFAIQKGDGTGFIKMHKVLIIMSDQKEPLMHSLTYSNITLN